nr:unnamed protein product [Callosobruchus chinensis]
MEVPTSDAMTQLQISEPLISKPVPRPFSIEALMSDDSGPKRSANSATCWGPIISHQIGQLAPVEPVEGFHQRELRDTDSEDGSLDMEMAQDLSNRSQKDGGSDLDEDICDDSNSRNSNHNQDSSSESASAAAKARRGDEQPSPVNSC